MTHQHRRHRSSRDKDHIVVTPSAVIMFQHPPRSKTPPTKPPSDECPPQPPPSPPPPPKTPPCPPPKRPPEVCTCRIIEPCPSIERPKPPSPPCRSDERPKSPPPCPPPESRQSRPPVKRFFLVKCQKKSSPTKSCEHQSSGSSSESSAPCLPPPAPSRPPPCRPPPAPSRPPPCRPPPAPSRPPPAPSRPPPAPCRPPPKRVLVTCPCRCPPSDDECAPPPPRQNPMVAMCRHRRIERDRAEERRRGPRECRDSTDPAYLERPYFLPPEEKWQVEDDWWSKVFAVITLVLIIIFWLFGPSKDNSDPEFEETGEFDPIVRIGGDK